MGDCIIHRFHTGEKPLKVLIKSSSSWNASNVELKVWFTLRCYSKTSRLYAKNASRHSLSRPVSKNSTLRKTCKTNRSDARVAASRSALSVKEKIQRNARMFRVKPVVPWLACHSNQTARVRFIAPAVSSNRKSTPRNNQAND